MIIQCIGHASFLIELESGYRIVTDPYDASTGYPVVKTPADAVKAFARDVIAGGAPDNYTLICAFVSNG